MRGGEAKNSILASFFLLSFIFSSQEQTESTEGSSRDVGDAVWCSSLQVNPGQFGLFVEWSHVIDFCPLFDVILPVFYSCLLFFKNIVENVKLV